MLVNVFDVLLDRRQCRSGFTNKSGTVSNFLFRCLDQRLNLFRRGSRPLRKFSYLLSNNSEALPSLPRLPSLFRRSVTAGPVADKARATRSDSAPGPVRF